MGPARTPYVESDPRVELEPNFYYPQEDLLFEHCKKHNIHWNIICPACVPPLPSSPSHAASLLTPLDPCRWIIGAVNNAAMNALHPLAVYAAVQAHKGEKLDFPGSLGSWISVSEHSTAMLTGYLTEWAALNEHCKDQKFNASDTSPVCHAL